MKPKIKAPHVQPLLESKPYTVVCAGVRWRFGKQADAIAYAKSVLAEWAGLGYRRSAQVYYRDGSIVAELSSVQP